MIRRFMPLNPKKTLTRRDLLILAGIVLFSVTFYLFLSAKVYRIGFPLDDSWIHQTYARNLARFGEWSFIHGHPSAGSTSPLWTFLLSLAYLCNLSPYIWTFGLGAFFLFAIAVTVENSLRLLIPFYQPAYPYAGILFALEWHLIWAALSGMETILFIFIILLLIQKLLLGSRNYLAEGLLIGLSIWVRPDGLTLMGPVLLLVLIQEENLAGRSRGLLNLFLGFVSLFFPYLIFNLVISSNPMPNTFYAKQAEYSLWQATPLGLRFFYFSLQFFQGAALILLPWFIFILFREISKRHWGVILASCWIFGFILIYVTRLPVYQHGRYLLPALSVYLFIGVMGSIESMRIFMDKHEEINKSLSLIALTLTLVGAFVYGGITYSRDTAYVEEQMVDTASWISKHIPATDNIAAHDIGALGYFCQNNIIDLAGLITPEIIPIMHNNPLILSYLNSHDVKYLVAFPNWKPELTFKSSELFTANHNFDDHQFDLTVYQWRMP